MSKKFKKVPRNWTEAKNMGWKTLIDYCLSFGKECPSLNCLEAYEKKFGKENEKNRWCTNIDGFTYYRPDFLEELYKEMTKLESYVSDLVTEQEKKFKKNFRRFW